MVRDRAMLSTSLSIGPNYVFEITAEPILDLFAFGVREDMSGRPEIIALDGPNFPQMVFNIGGNLEYGIWDRASHYMYQKVPDPHCSGLCVFSVGPVQRYGFSVNDGA